MSLIKLIFSSWKRSMQQNFVLFSITFSFPSNTRNFLLIIMHVIAILLLSHQQSLTTVNLMCPMSINDHRLGVTLMRSHRQLNTPQHPSLLIKPYFCFTGGSGVRYGYSAAVNFSSVRRTPGPWR